MTPERNQRIRAALAHRQVDLAVCLDRVHKTHNLSAIIRTAEAVGVHHVHAVWMDLQSGLRKGTSMGTHNWMQIHDHPHIEDAIDTLRAEGKQVLISHMSDKAVDFREIDYTRPTAIIMSQERLGACEEAIAAADQQIVVPMAGMVESLNVSVATAIVLYEAQRQRQLAGMYQQDNLPEQEKQRLLFLGGYPRLYQQCISKGLAFPPIDDDGQIAADPDWWHAMQYSKSSG